MKIFLDDERTAPEGWVRVETPEAAIRLLESGRVEALSLDHDLGFPDPENGYRVLLWLEEAVYEGRVPVPEVLKVHSANAGARPRMEQAIEAIRSLSRGRR